MKTLTKSIAAPKTKNLTRDAFFVLLGISVILIAVQIGYVTGIIHNFSWQH